MRGRGVRSVEVLAAVCAATVACMSACSHAWGDLEPTGASGSSSTAGSGGAASSSASSSGSGGDTTSSSTSTSTSSSTSSSSSSGTGGAAPTHCGGTDILSWDFSGDLPEIFNRYGPTDVSGGKGSVELPANTDNYESGTFATIRRHDFRGDRVSIKVEEVPNLDAGAFAVLELDYLGNDDLFMSVWQGRLECGFDHDGNESVPMDQPYDPVQHRYWQIREDQGTVYCETSPDGVTWHDAGSFALAPSLLAPPTNMRVKLFAVTPDHVSNPGAFRFDDLNGGGAPAGSWCKANSYSDDFADTGSGPGPAWSRWYTSYDADSIDQAGDKLTFHFGAEHWSSVGYGSSGAYDMTGQRVALEVLQLTSGSQGESYFAVGIDNVVNVFWTMTTDYFECAYDGGAVGYHTIWKGQPPALPAWVGLREAGGRVYCEILEGGAWKSYGSAEGIIDPTRADVFFGAYSYSGLTLGNYVTVMDGYNLAP